VIDPTQTLRVARTSRRSVLFRGGGEGGGALFLGGGGEDGQGRRHVQGRADAATRSGEINPDRELPRPDARPRRDTEDGPPSDCSTSDVASLIDNREVAELCGQSTDDCRRSARRVDAASRRIQGVSRSSSPPTQLARMMR